MQRHCADVNSPYKRKCWTNSGGPLTNSLLWGYGAVKYREVGCSTFKIPQAALAAWAELIQGPFLYYKYFLLAFPKNDCVQSNKAKQGRVLRSIEYLSLVMYYGRWGGGEGGCEKWATWIRAPPSIYYCYIGFWSRQQDGGFSSLCEALNVKKFIIATWGRLTCAFSQGHFS
jgi:hypothetical protein